MLSFDDLTRAGQVRRLRLLAVDALREHFGFNDVHVRLVADHSFNTVFRVDAGGDRFALRVGGRVRIHAHGVEDVEADWLDALAPCPIGAPCNIATTTGARWVQVSHPGVAGQRVCTLFSWVEGRELRNRLNAATSHESGRLLAMLHEHAALRLAPAAPSVVLARTAIYFGDRNLVATSHSPHGALFQEAEARVQAEIDRLWTNDAPPHALHGDFGPHNVLAWRTSLRPIDFQDMRFGHAVQDLGITIADMNRSRPGLVEPFLAGYAAVRELPELSPQILRLHAAARSLNIMNLGLLAPGSGIAHGFDIQAQRVVDWMSG